MARTVSSSSSSSGEGLVAGSRGAPETPAASNPRERRGGGFEVWLHIYDLGVVTGKLNELLLRDANLGAFHLGVEVMGEEWSFQGFHDAWDDDTLSGVVQNQPKKHPAYIYRESIAMGRTSLLAEEVDAIIDSMMEEWPANSYHLVARNCVTFAEEFTQALRVVAPFPSWVRGAVDAGKQPALFAVADYGWSWFKWWCKKQGEWEDGGAAALAPAAPRPAAAAAASSQQAASGAPCDAWGRPLPPPPSASSAR